MFQLVVSAVKTVYEAHAYTAATKNCCHGEQQTATEANNSQTYCAKIRLFGRKRLVKPTTVM